MSGRVVSPLATGNGAFVVHKNLETAIRDYKVYSYSPYRTLFPLSLFPLARSSKPKLIHTTPDYALFHKKRGVPLVLTFHNYVLDKYMRTYSSYLQNLHYQTDLKWMTKVAVNLAEEITAVSKFTANLAKSELGIFKEIKVIYNGVDELIFKPSKRVLKNKAPVKVLFSGNPTARKGAHWLIPILERLNSNVEIIYTAGLRNFKGLPKHPRLVNLGKVPYKNMPELYQSMDMLIFPTVREGFGLAAAEAMACGLPVVATNCSSLPELIDDGKGGFLCELGDVDDFAFKINLLAENEILRKEMGDYNRVKVEEIFTLSRMVSGYEELFDRIISKNSY